MEELRRAPDLLGESPIFLDTLAHVSAAAGLDRPLLIVGARGAGKELIAERVHFLSTRWEGAFVKVNCAALTDELLDSELFGHEAGAFTGAQRRHIGRFERAEGGTLFLDEIPSASPRVQEKLLRVIEYGEYERVGGDKTLTADVRVLAAANVDLPALAARGAFRADLLDRLAFDVINVPPLRARREDIPLLAAFFGAKMAAEIDATFEGFSQTARQTLLEHSWPGNVRELKNVAERSVYRWVADDFIGPVDKIVLDPFETSHRPTENLNSDKDEIANKVIPPHTRPAGKPPLPASPSTGSPATGSPSAGSPSAGSYDLRAWLDGVERAAVENALSRSHGSQKRAAGLLQLTYNQIRGLVRKHNLSPTEQGE